MLVRTESSVCECECSQAVCGSGGGGLGEDETELHQAERGPELRTTKTKAQEPGSWHNRPITICRVYVQGKTDTARHCEKEANAHTILLQKNE